MNDEPTTPRQPTVPGSSVECPVCKWGFANADVLKAHMDASHSTVPTPAPAATPPAPVPVPAPAKRPKKVKPPSRGDRWAEAVTKCQEALSNLESAKDELEAAASDLDEVKQEYQEWLDNLDGKFSGSALVEKLEAVTGLDIESVANDISNAIDEAKGVIDEAEGADLPLGFGRD